MTLSTGEYKLFKIKHIEKNIEKINKTTSVIYGIEYDDIAQV